MRNCKCNAHVTRQNQAVTVFSVDPTTAQTCLAVPWLRNMYRGTGDAECLRADELKSYDLHTKKPCGCTAYIQMGFTGAMAHCAAACHCPGSIPPHGTGKAGRTFKSLEALQLNVAAACAAALNTKRAAIQPHLQLQQASCMPDCGSGERSASTIAASRPRLCSCSAERACHV